MKLKEVGIEFERMKLKRLVRGRKGVEERSTRRTRERWKVEVRIGSEF